MGQDICQDITSERIRKVSQGYSYKKNGGENVKVEGLGGGFEYVELGDTLFNSDGTINESVSFEEMASYVFFTETHTNLDKSKLKGNYIGQFAETSYFLLFDGIGKNDLDRGFLKELKNVDGKKIIYADRCLLDEEILEKHQIVFKQIPYSVKVY
jgi:adenine-specific DNA-methyltransferase